MSLLDESDEAFGELLEIIDGSEITFNGISRPCVSNTFSVKRAQELQGYQIDASAQVTMRATTFAEFVTAGIKDRVSKVKVNGGQELVLMATDSHPNSAVTHLFLSGPG